MATALLVARLALAAVFAVAGAAKLLDPRGSRRAAEEFGVPASLAGLVGVLLPLAELAVAGALLPSRSASWGAFAALALLGLFVAAIAVNMARGRRPDCHCFGQLHSEPAGWPTLARNGALAAAAAVVVVAGWSDPGPSAVAWLADLDGSEAAAVAAGTIAAALTFFGGWAFVHLLRAHGRLLLRVDALEQALEHGHLHALDADDEAEPVFGLPVGDPAPAFALPDTSGTTVSLADLLEPAKPLLLLLTDPACGPCRALLPDVATWQREHADDITIAVVSSGKAKQVRADAAEHGLVNVLVDERSSVYEAYRANGTPGAVVVDPDGSVGSPVAGGAAAIERLLARTLRPDEPYFELRIGDPIPELELRKLDGSLVSTADFRGAETVYLFWDPESEACRDLHAELLEWEADPPPHAPQLVVLARGDEEAIRAETFASTVVVDDGSAARAFRARTTPVALLADADGNVAWPHAGGGDHILRLLRTSARPAAPADEPDDERPAVGDPVPELELSALDGAHVHTADFRGAATLYLFWNPACGFCRDMHSDLLEWEADPPLGAPRLVVVSGGDEKAIRAEGFASTVLLDAEFEAGAAFGAGGTPTAVLAGADGRVASPVAAGREEVLRLMRVREPAPA